MVSRGALSIEASWPAAPTGLQADPDDAAQSCQLDHATGRWACRLGVRWEQPTGNATVNYYRINYDESLEYCEQDSRWENA